MEVGCELLEFVLMLVCDYVGVCVISKVYFLVWCVMFVIDLDYVEFVFGWVDVVGW